MCASKAALAIVTLFVATAAHASPTVVFSSIANLTAAPDVNAYCSSCAGPGYEPLDQFTLASSATISAFDLVTQSGWYQGTGGFTFEIYDSTHSNVIFAQFVAPSELMNTAYGTSVMHAPITGLSLGAGTYWAGFWAVNLALPGFNTGGNNSLIETKPAHSGNATEVLGGNIGYTFYTGTGPIPEPASWAMMVGGFGLVGSAMRARRKTVVSFI